MAIFVDTGAWYAAAVPSDPDHRVAAEFLANNTKALILSDFIYAELLNLFRARKQMRRAELWLRQVERKQCEVVRATDSELAEATQVFLDYADKEWSFTDCLSKVMMAQRGIAEAFAFDSHFRQFGTIIVKPF
jgi:predicted nucleic acid-binding protein